MAPMGYLTRIVLLWLMGQGMLMATPWWVSPRGTEWVPWAMGGCSTCQLGTKGGQEWGVYGGTGQVLLGVSGETLRASVTDMGMGMRWTIWDNPVGWSARMGVGVGQVSWTTDLVFASQQMTLTHLKWPVGLRYEGGPWVVEGEVVMWFPLWGRASFEWGSLQLKGDISHHMRVMPVSVRVGIGMGHPWGSMGIWGENMTMSWLSNIETRLYQVGCWVSLASQAAQSQ